MTTALFFQDLVQKLPEVRDLVQKLSEETLSVVESAKLQEVKCCRDDELELR